MGERRLLTASCALLAGLLFMACGGGEEVSGPMRPMNVVGTEMAFAAPERVPAGHYQLTFQNAGATYHELAVKNPDGKIVTRRSIAGGRFTNVDVKLTEGTWELACYEPGHYEAGMHRQLVVDKP